MHCRNDLDAKEWDFLLSEIGGHPLQSALWGDAKKAVYGISDQRLAFYDEDKLAALVRVENKGLKYFFKVAWIPQGPALAPGISWNNIQIVSFNYLKKTGNSLCLSSPWQAITEIEPKKLRQTVWIDLTVGREELWSSLDKQWRYGVRSAKRFGMQISFATTDKEVTDFYCLCIAVSHKKTFNFQYTNDFLQYLLDFNDKKNVEAKLFLVKIENEIAAGAFILRVGTHCHYMWGAVDRKYSKLRVGEFVQWSVIEWACENNCVLYDLEGIDEINNPGVAAFKKKMGGEIVTLQNTQVNHFNVRGKILSRFLRNRIE